MNYERVSKLLSTIEAGCVEEQEMLIEFLEDFDEQYFEFDRELIRKAKNLSHLFGGQDLSKSSWRFYLKEISSGTFPLEKLPEHVREIAKELYYK
ncbi:hypothetical protein [Leptospira santarosai]|uniref:Uncharacterized protein n=1 Tax=Leptospira santarosai str. MOR084 TaxID=1049984 RepID=A0A0E2BBP9_9LEPT|nr:hypothetical protein [Leptospira santarosai]EKO32764.1 hypothetical protein LEP1GSC179_3009 [Leptospira santarosai str. MOR084]